MSSAYKGSKGKSSPQVQSRSTFGKKEKENRPTLFSSVAGHITNAAVTVAGSFFSFKSMGPAGIAGSALAGQAAGEAVKHYTGSFFGSRPSSGGAASSFSNIGDLKQAVAAEAKRATDEGDNSVTGAKSRLEAALQTIVSATDDSGHSAVEEMRAAVELAISLCDSSVLTASRSAQEKAGAWAGGL